jgi:cytochrome c-type biogenesis protein CcmF
MIDIHALGDALIHAGFVVAAFALLASLVGQRRRDGRLLLAGERAGYVVTGLMLTASFLLIHAFLSHDYANKYVQRYSDNNMPWYYLVAAMWGGQAGSLMFWVMILAVITGLVLWQNRFKNRDILPTAIVVLMAMQLFFTGLMIFEANPFDQFVVTEPPVNGKGLEPLLQNPAMTFHPPSILSGYVWFTVPFAFAIAALVHRRIDDAWIRTTRRYAVISWGFLSIGNLFGGMWAYEELGWGGFWGWDPVENAALMPWIVGTAYLHSVMIQERRGLLRVWNFWLVLHTFFMTVFGTFLTRAGVIDSVHTFAQSDVGDYFLPALLLLQAVPTGLLAWRVMDGSLRGGDAASTDEAMPRGGWLVVILCAGLGCIAAPFLVMGFGSFGIVLAALVGWLGVLPAVAYRRWLDTDVNEPLIESFVSREGMFLLNNLILVVMEVIVLFGTIGEKISAYFWQETKYSAAWFNSWIAPLGLALLLAMGLGTLIPWRRVTLKAFRRLFSVPIMGSAVAAGLLWYLDVYHLRDHIAKTDIPFGRVPAGRLLFDSELTGVYSLIGFFFCFFVFWTLIREFVLGASARARSTGESWGTAFLRMFAKKKRRFGGYVVHIGFAGLFLGFIGVGLKTEMDLTFPNKGATAVIEENHLTFAGFEHTSNREFDQWSARFDVRVLNEDGTPGELRGSIYPARRFYHGADVQMSRSTTEKDELFHWKGNVYLTLISFKPGLNQAEVIAHYNPMIVWMWIGGAFLLFGVVIALWPEPERHGVLAAVQKKRAADRNRGGVRPAGLADSGGAARVGEGPG